MIDANQLVWIDRDGREELIDAEPRAYQEVRLSPDGTRLALQISETNQNSDVWTYDLARGISARLTLDPGFDINPLWTPDGLRIVFTSQRDGGGLFWRAADGTGQAEQLTTRSGPSAYVADSFLPDGSTLLYFTAAQGFSDVYTLSMEGEQASEVLLGEDYDEDMFAVSPDGRWLAYTSDETGQSEVYVRPYPNIDDYKVRVSADLGDTPRWGPEGQELFYRRGTTLMVLSVETAQEFVPGVPEELFTVNTLGGHSSYDVSLDGQRFVMIKPGDTEEAAPHIIVVQNWFEELNRLVPTE